MRKGSEIEAPLLSVCLITYNHVRFIRQAIDSVLMQEVDFTWELIIADDYSTDGTREILLEYKEKYPDFIKLILQERNVGPGRNWIDLITSPKSKYIAYLEGDDYWTNSLKLKAQVEFLEANGEYCFHFHNVLRLFDSSMRMEHFNPSAIASFDPSLDDLLTPVVGVPSCSWLLRRDKLIIPFWISQCSMGDWPVLLMLRTGGYFRYSPEVMAVYRKHSDGLSQRINDRWGAMIRVLKFYKSETKYQGRVVSSHIGRLFIEWSANEKWNGAAQFQYLSYLWQAFLAHPSIFISRWRAVVHILTPLFVHRIVFKAKPSSAL